MSPQIYRGRTAVRFWLALATLGCVFAAIAASNAQALEPPVITNPGDLRYLSINTAFSSGDPDPAWTIVAPMPTVRSGFATSAADGKVYAMGGAVLSTCGIVDTVEAYQPRMGRWGLLDHRLRPIPPPLRYRPSGATLDNIIYLVGGRPDDLCVQYAVDTVQAYDPRPTRGQRSNPSRSLGPRWVLA